MEKSLPYLEAKVWGSVWHVFSSPFASFSYLEVKEGTRCSIHKHRQRANQFFVLEGSILVERFDPDNFAEPLDDFVLTEGFVYTVPSEIWHRFKVMRSGRVIEIYFPDREGAVCRMDDIERFDVGGKL